MKDAEPVKTDPKKTKALLFSQKQHEALAEQQEADALQLKKVSIMLRRWMF